MINLMTAIALALSIAAAATLFHFEALEALGRRAARRRVLRGLALRTVVGLVLIHLGEILLFALIYGLAANVLHIGTLVSQQGHIDALAYFYYSAETYSTLGYGDIRPAGELRLLASVEPLTGLLLLSWSGAFLFSVVQRNAAES
jgi:hypothetical protein